MCGIAGAIGSVDSEIVEAVKRMNAAQGHRGPDAQGCEHLVIDESAGKGVVLAHRRLSILDLSEGANQPMHDRQTGNLLVYNGEIYNFQEMRRELEAEGHEFVTTSDTEVVLKAYSKWGKNCVERFRGMFALGLWDAKEQKLVLMRDRMGIKPVYTARIQHRGQPVVLFASELRALLASGLVERKLNPEALASFLWHGFVVGRRSIVDGVDLLSTASLACIDLDCELEQKKYWSIDSSKTGTIKDTEELAEELQRAVKIRLVSDVPLGIFLSGGIDSSVVAALAVNSSNSAVRTFNISFDENEFDESHHARQVAEKLGTEHQEIRLTEQDFAAGLEGALASIDQPTFDAINTYFVSKAVREAGLTVALAGTGGDELFGGYSSFADLPKARRWAGYLCQIPRPLRNSLASAVIRIKSGKPGAVPPQTRWGKLQDVLDTKGDLLDLYQVSYSLFTRDFLKQLGPGVAFSNSFGLPVDRENDIRREILGLDDLTAISRLELESFISQRLLRDTDAASMAVSLEVRVPLLDHRVVEKVNALESDIRFQPLGKKQLLRELGMPELDKSLFDRPKAGFVLPIDRWARNALSDRLEETFTDAELCESVGLESSAVLNLWRAFQEGAPGLYWSRIWAIFVLLWWCRQHRVSL